MIIRLVIICHDNENIMGFSFFDKEGALLWKIGLIEPWLNGKTVELADNELIIGVVAKLRLGCQSIYTDFQFQIAKKYE